MSNNLVARLTIDAVRYEDHVTDVDTTVAARLKTMDDNIAAAKDTISANEKIINTNETNLTDLRKEIGATNRIDELNGVIAGADGRKADLTELIGQTESMAEAVEEVNEALTGYHGTEHQTLQERLNHDFDNVNQRVNDSMLLDYEGTYITADNTYYGLQKDTVVKGRTLQNLCVDYLNKENNTFTLKDKVTMLGGDTVYNSETYRVRTLKFAHDLKPNTTYTFIVNIHSLETSANGLRNYITDGNGITTYSFLGLRGSGLHIEKFTTNDSGAKVIGLYVEGEDGSAIISSPIILEGDYTQTPLEELPFIEGIQSVGDETPNLLLPDMANDVKYPLNLSTGTSLRINLEPGYTSKGGNIKYFRSDGSVIWHSIDAGSTTAGITLDSDITHYSNALNSKAHHSLTIGPSREYVPYYDGYRLKVKSCGKNLAKELTEENYFKEGYGNVSYADGKVTLTDTSGWASCRLFSKYIIPVKKDTIYYSSVVSDVEDVNGRLIRALDSNGNVISERGNVLASPNGISFSSPSYNDTYNAFVAGTGNFYLKFSEQVKKVIIGLRAPTSKGDKPCTFSELTFIEGNSNLTYEPYKESTYSYILNEPLRSLPNGVCDTIEGDKVIRRSHVVNFTGDEMMQTLTDSNDNPDYYYVQVSLGGNPGANPVGSAICDKLPHYPGTSLWNKDREGVIAASTTGLLTFKILTSRIGGKSLDNFRDWIKSNGLTVIYVLDTPIEEPLPDKIQLWSFDEQTHVTTDCYMRPNISTRIPSDVNAVVMGLRRENEALREEYEQQQLDNLETTLEQEVRVTMLEMGV